MSNSVLEYVMTPSVLVRLKNSQLDACHNCGAQIIVKQKVYRKRRLKGVKIYCKDCAKLLHIS